VLSEPCSGKHEYDYIETTPLAASTEARDALLPHEAVLPQRAMFHVLCFLCLIVEVPVYVYHYATCLGRAVSFEVGRDLYAVHLTSYLLLFAAFCIIVMLWSSVAVFEPSVWLLLANRLLLVLCAAYFGVTALAVGRCLMEASSSAAFFASLPFIAFCAFSIGALLLLAGCFLVLGCLLQRRICRALGGTSSSSSTATPGLTPTASSNGPVSSSSANGSALYTHSSSSAAPQQHEQQQQQQQQEEEGGQCSGNFAATVVRLNAVVLTCFVCFTLRALLLVQLLRLEASGGDTFGWTRWQQVCTNYRSVV
jgi:hypothetical protein